MKSVNKLIAAVFFLSMARASEADLRLPGMFSDSMVLQQGISLPIWGWASPGEKVVVGIAGRNASTVADKDGKWQVILEPLKANGKPIEMIVRGNNTIIIKDVLVGEVWLCSGQSNMAMSVSYCHNADAEIAAADLPQIRIYQATRSPSPVPQTVHPRGAWSICAPANAGGITATGFFFARELHKQLGVPIGLLNVSKGSVPIQTFVSIESLKAVPSAKSELESHEARVQDYLSHRAERDQEVAGDPNAELPGRVFGHPEAIYNSSIVPLAPFAMRGAIWYQGEGHAYDAVDKPNYYAQALPALIINWRQLWRQGDFPFIVVQLPNFKRPQEHAVNQGWSDFREEQCRGVQSVKNAGIICTIDIGEPFNIHPKNKQDVGKRLAFWALAHVYDKQVNWSGPQYRSMNIEGKKIRIHFDHAAGGLQAKGQLKGFAIAGSDKVFHYADAQIDGETVVVRSDKMQNPVAVRYAWAENPVCNLFNDADLPAMPFRTDNWAINEVKAAESD